MARKKRTTLDRFDPSWLHWHAARAAATILKAHDFDAYIIGGAVRDILLGTIPKDFDLVTNAEPEEILKIPEFERTKFTDSAQAFGVVRVRMEVGDKLEELEIASYRRDIEAHLGRKETKIEFASLEEDVKRRDFTINALVLDPTTLQLIDQVEGLKDLEKGKIRFIGKASARIQEDPLRILRGVRLKNQLGFSYTKSTLAAIQASVKDGALEDIAVDRTRGELNKMLTHSNRRAALVDMDTLGILERLLPELLTMKGVAQPPEFHSEGDVWEHTLWAMHYLPTKPSVRLAWATLLHDIGKPPTQVPAEETGDRIRFHGHHRAGAKLARRILKRLNFSSKLTKEIAWMVYYHMAIDDLPNMRPGTRQKFLDHPAFLDLLELHKADAHAAWSRDQDGTIDTTAAEFQRLEEFYHEHRRLEAEPTPSLKEDIGVDGHWLKQHFPALEGPQLGEILEELEQLYFEGKIKSKDAAKRKVGEILKNQE